MPRRVRTHTDRAPRGLRRARTPRRSRYTRPSSRSPTSSASGRLAPRSACVLRPSKSSVTGSLPRTRCAGREVRSVSGRTPTRRSILSSRRGRSSSVSALLAAGAPSPPGVAARGGDLARSTGPRLARGWRDRRRRSLRPRRTRRALGPSRRRDRGGPGQRSRLRRERGRCDRRRRRRSHGRRSSGITSRTRNPGPHCRGRSMR